MRVSTYTVSVPLRRQPFHLLLNGLTGALDKVDARVGQWFAGSDGAEVDPSAIPVSSVVLERLLSRGHLTRLAAEAERDLLISVATSLHAEGLKRAEPSFSFIPSYVCQLRCPYCFQPHSIHRGEGVFGSILTAQQIRDGFAIIDAMSSRGAFAQLVRSGGLSLPAEHTTVMRTGTSEDGKMIGLFGGEPLTEFTHEAVSMIAVEAEKRSRRVSAITNGVELDKFEPLLGPGPGQLADLQITFDGDQSTHDRRRIGPNHRATFLTISENVDLALSRGVAIHARMNMDRKNSAALHSLAAFFDQRGWTKNARFDFHVAAVDGAKSRNETLVTRAEVVGRTIALNQEGVSCVFSYDTTARQLLQRCLSSDDYPFTGTANCSAETGQVMFDPLGDVHSCWDEVGDRSRRIGTYDGSGLHIDGPVAQQWLSRFPGAIEECSRCPYALIHKSGCGSQARVASGSIFATDCKTFQQFFPTSLANAYEEAEAAVLAPAGVSEAATTM